MISQQEITQGKILVVDDNPANIQVVKGLLKKFGFHKITTSTNALEVTALYKEIGFDVILLDIHMPLMDGFQVMQQLHAQHPEDYIPVLVLTADTSTEIKQKSLAHGAKDFLSKPFDKDEVYARVRNIMHVSLLQKALKEQNCILEIKVRERTRQLEETHVKLIQCLGRAAEYRDNETGMHVLRIGKMTQALGARLGLSEQECLTISQASPMHDLGKIGITDHVLMNPGKLDAEQWAHMQTHTQIGGDILRSVGGELLDTAAIIAETHHEKWDGSGYPKGLKEKEIPLITRITTVCDVFDALMSERPYKKPWTLDQAVTYLIENAGRHFDPDVVEEFICILPQIVEIREQFADTDAAKKTGSNAASATMKPEISEQRSPPSVH